ncbi:RNA-binding motif protein, X-linked 2-like [Ostrea edulis]|uniref:RNA-binding motif protein, X-linked 2-like n=1 Tax=Ostrea edulis TaxID=37623 RepID=UPI0024AF0B56|nr:RNA-binding motif protein, X-linked 2-like [Ostrea edulis]
MNPLTNIKNVQKMNERELELGLIGKKSWHDQYKDSAWVFIGGLPYDLTEGDVIAVFSQYGELVNINLVRDGKTGKSRGFCFLCYEDQRSTVLAVDNLNGIKLLGRTIRVDHVEKYKVPKEHDDEDEMTKRLRMEGIAPKMEEEGKDSASEEDYLIPVKKHKKDKKAKKKKKKMKTKKHKEKHESESEDSEKRKSDQSPKSKKLHSEKQTKEKRQQQWTEGGNEGSRDYEVRDNERSRDYQARDNERSRESVRGRDIRHSPDRIRNDRYRDRSPRDRDYSPRRRDRDSPKRPGQFSSDRRDRNQDYSPKIRYRDPSPRRRNKDSPSPQRRDKFPRDRYRDGDRDRRR